MKKIVLALAIVLLFGASATSSNYNATCKGDKNCKACKNCKYCKHCAKDGGTCGVCKK